jgi:ankyrin repeat protein
MDAIVKWFQYLAVNILINLDDQSLLNFKDAKRENYEFMDHERFYWISEYFDTSNESWKMSTSKIEARFVKKLATAVLKFFKTAKQLTPLLIAAYDGNLDFFQKVKERTGNLNLNHTSTYPEISPIHLVAYRGLIELCRHILKESENKNIIGKYGLTSLHYAALAGHFEVYKLFYAVAEVKNPMLSTAEQTPLHLAAYKGDSDICKFIIEREDDKNYGFTIFGLAAQYGRLDICKLILRNVVEKTPRNINGDTPLHYVANYGCLNVCKLIIENIDEKNPGNLNGYTPLHLAAIGGHLNECKLIMANIDDIHPKNLGGKTPMDLAKERNQIYIIQLFRLADI